MFHDVPSNVCNRSCWRGSECFVIIMVVIQPHKQDKERGERMWCSLDGRERNPVCPSKRVGDREGRDVVPHGAAQSSLVGDLFLGRKRMNLAMTNRKGSMLACEVSVRDQERW